jgi:putative hydrolase of the HAD superfamily
MVAKLATIGFDADDTLWQTENFFRLTQDRFAALLADDCDPVLLAERLLAAEKRNLGRYGFGVKGFVLSMIEVAIEVTGEQVPASVIRELIDAGQDMLQHPIHLLPGAGETVATLAGDYHLVLITKGDLLDQERKLAQSGLGDLFDQVEIVSHKTPEIYRRIFTALPGGTGAALMVGNSMASDVLPPLQAGAYGVYVPSEMNWDLEHADPPTEAPRYHSLAALTQLPDLIRRINRS